MKGNNADQNDARPDRPMVQGRRLTCERCGGQFSCSLDDDCWCMAENVRLPLPDVLQKDPGGDCVCPACLRALATSNTAGLAR